MSTRKRIRSIDHTPASSTATVAWGANFGHHMSGSTFATTGSLSMPALQLSGTLTHTGTLSLIQTQLSGTLNSTSSVLFTQMQLSGALVVTSSFGDVIWAVTDMSASKDVYVDLVALCPVDVNHDTEDLILDSTVATRRDVYITFDL